MQTALFPKYCSLQASSYHCFEPLSSVGRFLKLGSTVEQVYGLRELGDRWVHLQDVSLHRWESHSLYMPAGFPLPVEAPSGSPRMGICTHFFPCRVCSRWTRWGLFLQVGAMTNKAAVSVCVEVLDVNIVSISLV